MKNEDFKNKRLKDKVLKQIIKENILYNFSNAKVEFNDHIFSVYIDGNIIFEDLIDNYNVGHDSQVKLVSEIANRLEPNIDGTYVVLSNYTHDDIYDCSEEDDSYIQFDNNHNYRNKYMLVHGNDKGTMGVHTRHVDFCLSNFNENVWNNFWTFSYDLLKEEMSIIDPYDDVCVFISENGYCDTFTVANGVYFEEYSVIFIDPDNLDNPKQLKNIITHINENDISSIAEYADIAIHWESGSEKLINEIAELIESYKLSLEIEGYLYNAIDEKYNLPRSEIDISDITEYINYDKIKSELDIEKEVNEAIEEWIADNKEVVKEQIGRLS